MRICSMCVHVHTCILHTCACTHNTCVLFEYIKELNGRDSG